MTSFKRPAEPAAHAHGPSANKNPISFFGGLIMSETQNGTKNEGASWPAAGEGGGVAPPITQAALANAAARAAASNARRDLVEYLRLRRKG
jgi:hypothetical protein